MRTDPTDPNDDFENLQFIVFKFTSKLLQQGVGLLGWNGITSQYATYSATLYKMYTCLEIPKEWSQLDPIQVDTDLVSLKTFGLLFCKAHINLPAGPQSLGQLSLATGAIVLASSSHQMLEIPM